MAHRTKAPDADEPSMDLTERIRTARLSDIDKTNKPGSSSSSSKKIPKSRPVKSSTSSSRDKTSVVSSSRRDSSRPFTTEFDSQRQSGSAREFLDQNSSHYDGTNSKNIKQHVFPSPPGRKTFDSSSRRDFTSSSRRDSESSSRRDGEHNSRRESRVDPSQRDRTTERDTRYNAPRCDHSDLLSTLKSDFDNHSSSMSKPSFGPRSTQSTAPSHVKSQLKSSFDQEMATRQTRMNRLSQQEKVEQEKWAQTQIQLTGACPAQYGWERYEQYNYYRCRGLHHVISDESLAEGKGGMFLLPHSTMPDRYDMTVLWGPYYIGARAVLNDRQQAFLMMRSDGNEPTRHYGGLLPKPSMAPDRFTGSICEYDDPNEEMAYITVQSGVRANRMMNMFPFMGSQGSRMPGSGSGW